MINPQHLRTFLAVLRHGSFAAAAQELGYTASAVSQQVASLERDADAVLFIRTARSISPTAAAEAMARHANRVLTDIETLLAATARADTSTRESLRLGIFPSLATYVLPRIMGNQAWKDLGIELSVSVAEPGQTISGLRDGGDLDLALVYQVGQTGLAWPAHLKRHWVGDDPFRVVVPAQWGFSAGATVTADQLSGMPWIMHHPGTPDAVVIERLFASCQLFPRVVAHSDDFNASMEMAAAGLGAALVPELALRGFPTDVVVLNVPDIAVARTIFALTPGTEARTTTARTDLFLHLVGDTLREVLLA